jgi:hypothetical protein
MAGHQTRIRQIGDKAESLRLECSCGYRDYFGTPVGETPDDTRRRAQRFAARHVASFDPSECAGCGEYPAEAGSRYCSICNADAMKEPR